MAITSTGAIYYFKDDLGNPLVGGKVYTYEYNTSQPKDTYKTGSRITPHTNPVILNDSGSVEWYLKGDYTIRVYTSEDVFVEEFNIVTPSKVQVDEVSDSLNLLKSDLKDAAYCDTGTAAAQVPLNSDLGTAAYKSFSEDANGFIRKEGSTSEVVIKDAAGVAAVNGIQAGIGAPKIAYKKLTGIMPVSSISGAITSVAHGLNADKILGISVTSKGANGNYSNGTANLGIFSVEYNAANIAVRMTNNGVNLSSQPFKILITYEL